MPRRRAATGPPSRRLRCPRAPPYALHVGKEPLGITHALLSQESCAPSEVAVYLCADGGAERHQSRPASLAHDCCHPAPHVNVGRPNSDGLAQAASGVKEEQDQRTVAGAKERAGIPAADHVSKVVWRHCFRRWGIHLEWPQPGRRVGLDQPFRRAPAGEGPHGAPICACRYGFEPRAIQEGRDEGAQDSRGEPAYLVDPLVRREAVEGIQPLGVVSQGLVGAATHATRQHEVGAGVRNRHARTPPSTCWATVRGESGGSTTVGLSGWVAGR